MRHVALVIPHRLAYCRGVLRGVAKTAAFRSDWRFTLVNPLRADAATLRRLAPDGILALVFDPRLGARLRRLGPPVVSIADALPDLPIPLVVSDDFLAGRQAGEHLLAAGLTSFAYLGYARYGFARNRLAGFRAALGRHALAPPFFVPETTDVDPSDDLLRDSRALAVWLRAMPRPVGVFADNDILGLRLIELCRELGLRVPDDVAVVGVDDDDLLCGMARPPLSSVTLPTEAIGRAAAALLDQLMEGARPERTRILLPPRGVTARQSSDLQAVSDPGLAAALGYLRGNAHHPIRVRDLLRAAPLGRRTLERRFRRHFGRSPRAEMLRVRLARARHLLATSDLPVVAIAERCGFREGRLLSAALRKADGLTARAYRARFR